MPDIPRVDYDSIAAEYDRRYESQKAEPRGQALQELAERSRTRRILEAGCGTGHWLKALYFPGRKITGLDYSMGMLQEAGNTDGIELVRASAEHLPFCDRSFGLIYCVDAIHHFPEPATFIRQAWDCLDDGGMLAIIGMDPHDARNCWYAYDWFEGMLATDLQRFPAGHELMAWMEAAGFVDLEAVEVERLDESRRGREILEDPFLGKGSCSQMALLSEQTYQAGLERLKAAIGESEVKGEELQVRTVLCSDMLTGRK